MLKLIILHSAVYILGVLCLRFFLSPNNRNWRNYLTFSYPVGLLILCAVAFSLNQFSGIGITYQGILITVLIISAVLSLSHYFLPLQAEEDINPPECKTNFSLPENINKYILPVSITFTVSLLLVISIFSLKVILDPLNDWDTFLYHLPIARHLLQTGNFPARISPSYMEMENAYPPSFFFLYALNWISLGTIEFVSPKILCAIINLLCFLILYKIQRRLGGRSLPASIFSVFLLFWYIATPKMFRPSMYSFTLLYFLAGLYFFFSAGINNSVREFYLAVIFWAGAYWTNYIGLLSFAVIMMVCVILYLASRYNTPTDFPAIVNFKTIFTGISIFALIISPHILRNWIRLGNPLYPGFSNFFGGYLMNEWTIKTSLIKYAPPDLNLLREIFLGKYKLLSVAALLGCIEIEKKDYSSFFAPLFVVLYVAIWAVFFQLTFAPVYRYLTPPCAIVAISMGYIIDKIFADRLRIIGVFRKYRKQATAAAVVIVALVLLQRSYYFIRYSVSYINNLRSISLTGLNLNQYDFAPKPTLKSNLELTTDNLPPDPDIKPDIEWINRNLPPDAGILTFEDRLFFLARDYVPGDHLCLKAFYQTQTPTQALQELRKLGITHFYYLGKFEREYEPFNKSVLFNSLDNRDIFDVVYKNGDSVKIYRVNYSNG